MFWMALIPFVILSVISVKAVTIGSEFSFYNWVKYGKIYSGWYFDRQTFKEHLKDFTYFGTG